MLAKSFKKIARFSLSIGNSAMGTSMPGKKKGLVPVSAPRNLNEEVLDIAQPGPLV